MSAPNLPEDLSQWPTDPYQLLGVAPGIAPRDLRRAYTNLIRTFKPEQYPEHFRRIREAYEHVRRQAEFFQAFAASQAEDETPAAEVEQPEPIPAPRPWSALPDPDEELRQLWQRVGSGEEAAVYRRLVEMHDGPSNQIDACLRLYWLLVLQPELDPARSPSDWLAAGLRISGLTGGVRELYRREILDDPAEALSERCTRLLQLPVRAGLRVDLAEWRWQAAGRLGRWQIIAGDLDTLRAGIVAEDEEIWLRLLMSAVEQLIALPDDGAARLARQCWDEINRCNHLHGGLTDTLDRLELLLEVAQGLRKLPQSATVAPALLRLLPLSWTRPFVEVRPLLLAYLAQVTQAPREALRTFDHIQNLAPVVLTQFGHLLALLQDSLPPLPEPDTDEDLTQAFLDPDPADHAAGRIQLLNWCVQELLPPEVVAPLVGDAAFAEKVRSDWPLRYVCWACRLFWA